MLPIVLKGGKSLLSDMKRVISMCKVCSRNEFDLEYTDLGNLVTHIIIKDTCVQRY